MANTLLTASIIARAALANLYESTVMLPLVHRDYEPEFLPGAGATVTIRKPTTFVANDYNGSTISVQNAVESSTSITLDKHKDVSFRVTSADMALKIVDFNEQLLQPAMEAISQAVDEELLSLRDDITQEVGVSPYTDTWHSPKSLVDARTVLSASPNNVPLTERRVVVPVEMSGEWLKSDEWGRVDASGDTEALREASMGTRKSGFDPYESNHITDGIGVAFHRTAFAVAFRPLMLPRGAADAAIMDYKGIGIRVVYDYDMNLKSDTISLDVLFGVKTLDARRAVLINGSGS